MGYESELIFNKIEVPKTLLHVLRYSLHEQLRNKVAWSYMLCYLTVEDCNGEPFDLRVPKRGGGIRKVRRGLSQSTLEKIESSEHPNTAPDDGSWYYLGWSPYDGTWDVSVSKWYHVDEFVSWLAPFCQSGYLFQLVHEGDGGLWGWQFEQGKYRGLALNATSRWKCHKPKTTG